MSTTHRYNKPFTLYSIELIEPEPYEYAPGRYIDAKKSIFNSGRVNYRYFQEVIADLTGLESNSEGGDSDLIAIKTQTGYEVKAFHDITTYPERRYDTIHVAASSTFGPNNRGPVIKSLLDAGQYGKALEICRETGYDKNEYYILSNTRGYNGEVPLKYLILPTEKMLQLLSRKDPRVISRNSLFDLITKEVKILPPQSARR